MNVAQLKQIYVADNGRPRMSEFPTAALEMISSEAHYDVLIFDNELPDTDGIDLIRQTRQLSHRQQTPIIMFSASEAEREARRVGANAFLRKPEDINAIAETVARLLARKPKR